MPSAPDFGRWRRLAPCHVLLFATLILPAATAGGDFAAILVDGESADWQEIPPALVDPSGDNGASPIDLGSIHVANDDTFVFLRFEIGALLNLPAMAPALRLFVDSDASITTGYAVEGIGSDIVVEFSRGSSGVAVYEQTAASFYATNLGHAPFEAYHGPTVAGTEFEFRLGRDTFLPQHGTVAFPGPAFKIALVALTSAGQPADRAPDLAGSLNCTFASGTPPPPPDNDLLRTDPRHIRFLTYNSLNGNLFGAAAARLTRILQAIAPDIIAFQETWDVTPAQISARLDHDLPLPGGASWTAVRGNRGQTTASRFPFVHDTAAPSGELATSIDLPDAAYDRDVYVINSHFKCCGSIGTSEDAQRQAAADAIVGWIRELQTPGGADLPAQTPILHMGDLNLVGGPGPLLTLLTGDIADEATYGPDHAPDWDGSESERAAPIHSDGLASYTWRRDSSAFAPGKLDYLIYTGSVASTGNRFVLNTADMSPDKLAVLGLLANDTREASDHLPTVLDLMPDSGVTHVAIEPLAPPHVALRATPNPFRSLTNIEFELPSATRARLRIYDSNGRLVRKLIDGELAGGAAALTWEGTGERGQRLASGTYFMELALIREDGALEAPIRKLTLVR